MPIQKLITYLWFDNEAEEAVDFYKKVFKDNLKIINKIPYVTDTPSNKSVGSLMIVQFELFGCSFGALNGGPDFKFNEAVSFQITCEDQKEMDYYYDQLSAVPEAEICGWLKDKYGLSWQVSPQRLEEIMSSEDKSGAKRAMDALLKMKRLNLELLEKAFKGD